jgi:Flp pilus assembly protein protease CpaA|tara:strand:- start:20617 stop:21510 length:894 start_codon:yes stop_codon:yes gene_type:complete
MVDWFGVNSIPQVIAFTISFVVLLIGSITDLKTREVPDWVNYGLIISGVSLNLLFSIIYSNSSFIINSIVGLLVFFGIAYIMFYAGQWGGGDSKILMGLGAMIGIDVSFSTSQFLFGFFINALFVGAIYGLLWSILLVFKNKKKFWKEFSKYLSNKKVIRTKKFMLIGLVLLLVSLFLIKLFFIKILILSLAFLMLTTFYLWIFVKAIERSSMFKLVEPSKLTEGDWIVKDIVVNKKYIAGPKDLGIEKSQIKKLIQLYRKRKIKKILIKEGIPFVPSFLIAFIVTFLIGSPLVWLL